MRYLILIAITPALAFCHPPTAPQQRVIDVREYPGTPAKYIPGTPGRRVTTFEVEELLPPPASFDYLPPALPRYPIPRSEGCYSGTCGASYALPSYVPRDGGINVNVHNYRRGGLLFGHRVRVRIQR